MSHYLSIIRASLFVGGVANTAYISDLFLTAEFIFGRYVSPLVTSMYCGTTAESIEVPSVRVVGLMGPTNHRLSYV